MILADTLIPLALGAGLWFRWTRPWESPIERAYRLCQECSDLLPFEVDDLIGTMRASPVTRYEKLQAFRPQYTVPTDAEPREH